MTADDPAGPVCPLPHDDGSEITLAHGGGGRLMHRLIEDLFATTFAPAPPGGRTDAALLSGIDGPIALTTDAYVVSPPFFPGGDIGRLAIVGTCNDLAVVGAEPLRLAVALVLEEGLPLGDLRRVCRSIAAAAAEVGAKVVTGDTKVVERGKGDGLYVTTTGVGRLAPGARLDAARIATGDVVIATGDVARHGIAVMAAREGLSFVDEVESDVAHLWPPIRDLLAAGVDLRWARDATRGGFAGVLVELAEQSGAEIGLAEPSVPIEPAVAAACELLGFDPLFVANEGCAALVVPRDDAERTLGILRRHPSSHRAAAVGEIGERGRGRLVAVGPLGTRRALAMPSGEQLPRIC